LVASHLRAAPFRLARQLVHSNSCTAQFIKYLAQQWGFSHTVITIDPINYRTVESVQAIGEPFTDG
jgi:hypothetical protein